jgi:hypothetical protein
MSPCDYMTLFVAKSSPERTRVPRRVTDRVTVRCLVNTNPGRPRTSSTAAPRKPQHHRLRSPRSESQSFFFLKRVHGIVKRAIQEAEEGGGVLTVNFRKPSHEFTFGVGMNFISYPLVLTPLV